MNSIKTIIVDDEKHARENLSRILSKQPDIDVVKLSCDGKEAISDIDSLKPDLVFLDVEMPEINGFEVLSNIDHEKIPVIVFVTAFEKYAVKAFEVNAIDYINKPIDEDRIRLSLIKVRNVIALKNQDTWREKIEAFLKSINYKESNLQRFIIKKAGTINIVKASQVHWIEASGNYINIITGNKKYILRSSLSGVDQKLNKNQFFRIHRSTIVNIDYVDKIEETGYGDYTIQMKSGEILKMSRNFTEILKSV